MSTQVDLARIVLLNRTVRELLAANPVLLSGEAAVADVGTIRPDLRFGDGVRPWSALPSFKAGGIGGGYFAPFEVQNTINGHALFRVNDIPGLGPGEALSVFGPGEAAGDIGLTTLLLNGAVNGYVLQVDGATHTQPNIYLASFAAQVNPGRSNGVWIAAGTNSNDACFLLENAASTYDPAHKQQFMLVRGDGSGVLGPAPNQLVWDAHGNFNLTGTATLPGRTMSELTDVSISGLRLGDVLQWNGTRWGNVAHLDGYVTWIETGTGLSGGPITSTGTIRLADTMVTPGAYTNANLTVDQQGRINYITNGNDTLAGLTDIVLTDPAEGQALTWDGTHWINSTPANALETLTDVDIVDKAQGEVLSWNEQTNKWTNSPLPGGSVIALETLQDVDITDPEPGQVLTWDGSNWVNEKGGGGASVTVDTTPPADPESGWLWWDAVSGQLFVWYDDGTSAQWVIANSDEGFGGGGSGGDGGGGATALAQLTDVAITNPAARNLLTYNGTQWVNGGPATLNGVPDATTLIVNGSVGTQIGNVYAAEFRAATTGPTISGAFVRGGNSSGNAAFRVDTNTMTHAFAIAGDGTGVLGPGGTMGGKQMTWDANGVFTVPNTARQMIGLSVPIAFSWATVASAPPALSVMVTMPLTIPANLTYSRAQCSTATTATRAWGIWKYNNAVSGSQIGTLTFASGTFVGTFSGSGTSLVAGDVLRLVPVADAAQADISVTIHATRA